MSTKTATRRPTCPTAPPPPHGGDGASAPVPVQQSGAPPRQERDQRGRFLKGHKGLGGRKRRSVEVEYLACLSSVVSLSQWKKVCETALRQAIAGDDRSREFLARYVLGRNPVSLAWLAAREVSSDGLDYHAGDTTVLDALAQQIGETIAKRYGFMVREYAAAERAMEEFRGEADDEGRDEDTEA